MSKKQNVKSRILMNAAAVAVGAGIGTILTACGNQCDISTPDSSTPTSTEDSSTIKNYDMSGVTFSDQSFTYDGEKHSILIDGELPEGLVVSYYGNGQVNAGTYTVTARFHGDDTERNLPKDMTAKIIINKAEVEGITFPDLTVDYDGEPHSLEIKGILPEGVSVFYSNNGMIDAGSYSVVAHFNDSTGNYLVPEDRIAKLTINKVFVSAPTLEANAFTYDGTEKEIHVLGLDTNLMTISGTRKALDAGAYLVLVSLRDQRNYQWRDSSFDGTLRWNILPQDLVDVSFEDMTLTYDGEEHSILISGDLPSGIRVIYEGNGKKNAGVYTITAHFLCDNLNYILPEDKTATLTIEKNDDFSFTFLDETITYDGNPHSLLVQGELPSEVSVSYSSSGLIDAGTYTIIAHFHDPEGNYVLPDDQSATLVIEKAVVAVPDLEQNRLYYSKTDQTVTLQDYDENLMVAKGTFVAKECGTYSITITLKDAHNYQWSDETFDGVMEWKILNDFTYYEYTIDSDGEATITRWKDTASEANVPGCVYDENGSHPVVFIGESAFLNLNYISTITLPDSVLSIWDNAFDSCSSLTRFRFSSSLVYVGSSVFAGCTSLSELSFDTVWDSWPPVDPDSDTSKASFLSYFFGGLVPSSLKKVSIEKGFIQKYAFKNITSLTAVSLGEGVTGMGQAFSGCTGLNRVDFPSLDLWTTMYFADSLSNPLIYAHNLYLNGRLLDELYLDNFYQISDYAFQGATCISVIYIGSNLRVVRKDAFLDCSGLHFVFVNDGGSYSQIVFESRGSNPLANLSSATLSLERGGTIKQLDLRAYSKINQYAYIGYTGLNQIMFGKNLEVIEENAFELYRSMGVNVSYEGTMAEWNSLHITKELLKLTVELTVNCSDGDVVIKP